ncbi:putative portal protein [Bacteriophage DSS3_PM1]|nr:putative portal protein [Bacteriophage DSS3_PM1]
MSEQNISVAAVKKSVATPSHEYESMRNVWAKCRAIIRGQESVKAHDAIVNDYDENGNNRNLLLPFSPSMTQAQYDFYKDEAELPGITSQYAKSMIGALLRKDADIEIPEELPETQREEITEWLRSKFTSDNRSLFHFLDNALWEEIQTSSAWVYVDVPDVDEDIIDQLTPEQKELIKPYPTLLNGESVINVIHGIHPVTKVPSMVRFVTRQLKPHFTSDNPWHPKLVDTVRDHYLDETGLLVVDEWVLDNSGTQASSENGKIRHGELEPEAAGKDAPQFEKKQSYFPEKFGKRLTQIPAWPLDGESFIEEPILLTFVNREVGLYNKVSRRNHLMYGAATYTPIIIGDTDEEAQAKILSSGLGSIWFLEANTTVDTLAPPTESLTDMQNAISATMDELARMGIRMLAPDTAESGVALELRNAGQTASLGTLNQKISTTMRQVFAFMINWRYDMELTSEDIKFTMSSDFSPQAQGEAGMRLVGEWYQMGLIPRSVFLDMAKKNDYIPSEYDDNEGQEEMEKDPVQMANAQAEQDVTIQE